MDNLILSAETIIPIFLLIFFGFLLQHYKVIDQSFVSVSSRIVFRYALPVMVFQRMVKLDGIPSDLLPGVALFAAASIFIFFAMWGATNKLTRPVQGSVVQGSFRSNIAIIGLAVIQRGLGDVALSYGVVLLAVMMPMYNVGAIIILSRSQQQKKTGAVRDMLRAIATNPLIWGVITGLFIGLLDIPVPFLVDSTFDILSSLTLPLALINIGASLRVDNLINGKQYWITAVFVKILILPLIIYLLGIVLNIDSTIQAVIVIAAACPTAVASFIMAENFGADSQLASEIVSIGTMISIVTLALWLLILI